MDDERERQIELRRQDREQRRQDRIQQRRERAEWRRSDPVGQITGALILIWMGVLFLAAQNSETFSLGPFRVTWTNVWMYVLAGLGALLIVQGILRAVLRVGHGVAGPLIGGTILLLIGLSGALPGLNWATLWPLILIIAGVGLLLATLLR